ncbi:MAG: TIM barrel protein [Clostridia bacterium]
MIKFGPSGRCEQFELNGFSSTMESAIWVKSNGLDCFEYSFGRGVVISPDSAAKIGDEFAKNNIEISVHAPYFINLATLEDDKAVNNLRYIFDSLSILKKFGGSRCVFHPGSPLKQERGQAVSIMLDRFEKVLIKKHELGFDDIFLCPETMGKKAQLGNLEEIIGMCRMGDDKIVPCVDWGHLNSRDGGIFFEKDDYKKIIDRLVDTLGFEKTSNMHMHFSKIQFSEGGEVRHLTFDDKLFGPPFEPLMEVLYEYKMQPYIVCESAGTQTYDAKAMKDFYLNLK